MMKLLWIGLCLLIGCATEYGQELRCTVDTDCADGRVCEPIQRYCVLPEVGQGADATGASMDGQAPIELDGGSTPEDATSPAVDASQSTTDAAPQPMDAGPTADGSRIDMMPPTPEGCGDGNLDEGEECDIPSQRRNEYDICGPTCEYVVTSSVHETMELIIPQLPQKRRHAENLCADWGGGLVVLSTDEIGKLAFLLPLLGDQLIGDAEQPVWVGLRKMNQTWTWRDGRAAMGLQWCGEMEPNQSQSCALLNWQANAPCFIPVRQCADASQEARFVCERPLE